MCMHYMPKYKWSNVPTEPTEEELEKIEYCNVLKQHLLDHATSYTAAELKTLRDDFKSKCLKEGGRSRRRRRSRRARRSRRQ